MENHPDVQRLLDRFPTAIRSSNWPDMVAHIRGGEFDKALELALKMERNENILQQNVVGRRMRIARASMFSAFRQSEKDLASIFAKAGEDMAKSAERWANDTKGIKKLQDKSWDVTVWVRKEFRKLMRRLLWDVAVLGLKNSGQALKPVFDYNRESLREDRLVMDLDTTFAKRNTPEVAVNSAKWIAKIDRILDANANRLVSGMNLSSRIFELTRNMRLEMDRIVSVGVADGKGADVIARKLKQYTSPKKFFDAAGVEQLPRGAYYSPYKNALRITRTEGSRVYTKTTAAYAEDKWWIKGVMITLSPRHEQPCVCEDWAGKVVSAQEFGELVPFHPHCMCYPTYVFDEKVFEEAVAV